MPRPSRVEFSLATRPASSPSVARPPRRAALAPEALEGRRLLSVNVTTYHYDNARSGANTQETTLTPANVNSGTFGKVAGLSVDGLTYAQPLVITGVAVPGQGTRDIVLVATEADDVYAFDATGNEPAGGYLWRTSLLQSGETTVPKGDYGTTDITPQVGITGTPVIDAATDTFYVVGSFKESNGTYEQRLYALDVATGQAKFGGPVTIAATVKGTGDGSANGVVSFSAFRENQRPALTLANGQVYVAWASHADQGPYHGWVIGYNAATLKQEDVFNVNPNGSDDGIWMSGGGIAVDAEGNLYFTTGNGTFDASTGGSDYGMSLVELSPTLQVEDYFTPDDEAVFSSKDLDYGCSDVVLLSAQTGGDPNEILTAGKWGTIYLNDGDTGKLGKFESAYNDDLGEANIATDLYNSNVHNTISYWDGHVYIGGDTLRLQTFGVAGGKLSATPSSSTAKVFGDGSENGQGTGPTISANGDADGIVWAVDNSRYDTGPAVLYAYDATNLSDLLYSSNQAANGRDTAATANKYQDAVVANGYVYVGGDKGLTIYGLLKGTTSNGKPTVTTAAAASPSTVTGTTTRLSVAATDTTGDAAPTYSWAATAVPAGATAPTFSVNGTAAAAGPTVTFHAAGAYTFTVTVTDPTSKATATSTVRVTVDQTLTAVALSPSTASVLDGATQQFTAKADDQFGLAMTTQPTFTYAVKAGGAGGTITAAGLYKAPAVGTGAATVTATTGSQAATATVTVTDSTPTGTTAQVSLAAAFDQVGIVTDGSTIAAHTGLDGHADALSGNLLGTSEAWAGSTFAVGAASAAGKADNVVQGLGQTITLTQGNYAALQMLATHVNGSAAALTFTVTYTDGTTQTITQGVSDWNVPQGYAGESEAVPMAYRDTGNGREDHRTYYVYGFSFALNAAKKVKSLTLPHDNHFELLAIDLAAGATTPALVTTGGATWDDNRRRPQATVPSAAAAVAAAAAAESRPAAHAAM